MKPVSPTSVPAPAAAEAPPGGLALLFHPRRLLTTFVVATVIGLLLSLPSLAPTVVVWLRALIVAFSMMLVYGLLEQWPRRLPRRLPRWVLQLVAVMLVAPPAAYVAYAVTLGGLPDFANDPMRRTGFSLLAFIGILVGPWITLGAQVRDREARAEALAMRFAFERSELERRALDARLQLLQAQVQPHFLFNTLANVRELVVAGAPEAPRLLDQLIEYLRAAVPRLGETGSTIDRELQLVRAYLGLMQMRMPDRLRFTLEAEAGSGAWACPPATLLTLVENAVKHGIDPSEVGGEVRVSVRVVSGRCHVAVADTGVGLAPVGAAGGGRADAGLGTGLGSLAERLRLQFGSEARLELLPRADGARGVVARLEFPAVAPAAGT